jgi:hypothetical protein
MRGTLLLVGVLTALLAMALGTAWFVWRELADVEMPTQGWYALLAGVTATLALGIGLMRLVYISAKRGYDDEAGSD